MSTDRVVEFVMLDSHMGVTLVHDQRQGTLAAYTTRGQVFELYSPKFGNLNHQKLLHSAAPTTPERAEFPGERFPGELGPCSAVEEARFARALRHLLLALDGQIVVSALIGDRVGDLLGSVREEMDRVREFLHDRIPMRAQPSDFRGGALAVLDAYANQIEPADSGHESSSPTCACGAPSVGEEPPVADRFGDESATGEGVAS